MTCQNLLASLPMSNVGQYRSRLERVVRTSRLTHGQRLVYHIAQFDWESVLVWRHRPILGLHDTQRPSGEQGHISSEKTDFPIGISANHQRPP